MAQPHSPEWAYTREHVKTRCNIEQNFGRCTAVWRIVKRERMMRYTPKKASKIITATAVLHNFRLFNG